MQVFFGADAVAPCCEASVDLGNSVELRGFGGWSCATRWDPGKPVINRVYIQITPFNKVYFIPVAHLFSTIYGGL